MNLSLFGGGYNLDPKGSFFKKKKDFMFWCIKKHWGVIMPKCD